MDYLTYRQMSSWLVEQLRASRRWLDHENCDPDAWKLFSAWANLEDTQARYNPWATTLSCADSSPFNEAGVQNYLNPETGIRMTVRTLLGSFAKERGYLEIVDTAFNADASWEDKKNAISTSAWSGLPRDGDHYLIPDFDEEFADRQVPVPPMSVDGGGA